MAEMCRPAVALCDSRLADDLAKAAIPACRTATFGCERARRPVRPGRGASRHAFDDVATAADDVALLAFTSGTTGRPKATMHFHRDVLAIADTFSAHVLRPEPDDVFTGSPPIGFTFGLGGLVVFPLRVGASALLLERATPDQLADAVARHGVTSCSPRRPPTRRSSRPAPAEQLTGLRRAVSAGEALPGVGVARRSTTRPGSGSSTASARPRCCTSSSRPPTTTSGPAPPAAPSPGTPPPCSTTTAARCPTGRRATSPSGDPRGAATSAATAQEVYVRHGWNFTGDTYVRDADGYFHYQARTDDMIISAGYNIAGPEVEQALLGHPEVVECAVVGAPDEERGMIVKAFVVLNPDAPRGT